MSFVLSRYFQGKPNTGAPGLVLLRLRLRLPFNSPLPLGAAKLFPVLPADCDSEKYPRAHTRMAWGLIDFEERFRKTARAQKFLPTARLHRRRAVDREGHYQRPNFD